MLLYKKGSLFEAPSHVYLAHSTNSRGVMGAGIALEFKKRYFNAFKKYQNHCFSNLKNGKSILPGTSFIAVDDNSGIKMLCLFTSNGYGKFVDSEEDILLATESAIRHFIESNSLVSSNVEIHSPKINAGLFRVEWEKTEKIILKLIDDYPLLTWTVWDI